MVKTALIFAACGLLAGVILCESVRAWASSGRGRDVGDCRPHLYMSGTVEVRGRPGQLYVLQYRDLPELAKMLQVVDADVKGQINWMGTD